MKTKYRNNQKTVDYEDDILKQYWSEIDVVTKHITSKLSNYLLSEMGLFTLHNSTIASCSLDHKRQLSIPECVGYHCS